MLAERSGASAVGVSVSVFTRGKAAPALADLRSKLARKIELVVGGAGAPVPAKGITKFSDLRELDVWAQNLAR